MCIRDSSSTVLTISDSGMGCSSSSINCLKRSRSSAWSMADNLVPRSSTPSSSRTVSYTHLRAHETVLDLVCRLLLEKKNLHNSSFLLFSLSNPLLPTAPTSSTPLFTKPSS
ncbi:hypothetical protein PVA38_11790 [Streptococcus pneumoniae D39]|nr:hypothetical protein PVA38_11790 [Streptococcus pneumoniae D39]